MSNEVFEAARTILAVREFDDRPVSEDAVRRVVESAHLTASSQNRQPWCFVVVQEREGLQRLGELVRTGPYTASAAFAVIVGYEKASRFGISDASRAIQTMMLTAWAEGIGSNWTGFVGMEEVGRAFGIPDSFEICAVLPFGYPKRRLGLGRKNRKPIGEVAFREQYGRPFS